MPLLTSAPPATIGETLAKAARRLEQHHVDPPKLTAETLLAHALGVERVFLYAHPEQPLDAAEEARYRALVDRRASGEPTQYLVGRQEFFGLDFEVTPDVLIPRPETEHAVEVVLREVLRREASDRAVDILDLATGSGCIAVALSHEAPAARVTASDISSSALAVAHRNARFYRAPVRFVCGDLLSAFRPGSFDIVVCNPPYVAESERRDLQREIFHEPEVAVFGGADGLDPYRRLIPQAAELLGPGGLLVLELGHRSLPETRRLLADRAAWEEPEVVADLAGVKRVTAARRRG